jgi:Protein of unknown function (DUF2924)
MPIEDRNPQAGTVLVGRHKGTQHRCEVVETPEGVRYQIEGETFKSASSAAKHVTGGAINGWVFWSIAGTEKPKREPGAKADKPNREPAPKKPAKARAAKKGRAKKAKSARMASDVSYGCGVCSETFPTQKKAVAHTLSHTA